MLDKIDFPLLNCTLNGISGSLLVLGLVMIKMDRKIAHRNVMLSATFFAGLFLISYLTYHFTSHLVTKFTHEGIIRYIYYYVILIPHILLAMVNLPMVIITLTHAFKGNFEKHRRIAPWTWGVWFYVSISGVLVYMMLYQWFPSHESY
ncbi:MAG: DUF420 domain-containing protein [Verrucomicrobiota bacterium]